MKTVSCLSLRQTIIKREKVEFKEKKNSRRNYKRQIPHFLVQWCSEMSFISLFNILELFLQPYKNWKKQVNTAMLHAELSVRDICVLLIVLFYKLDCDFCIIPKVLELLGRVSTKLPIVCFFRAQKRVEKRCCLLPIFSNIFSLWLTVMLLRWHLIVLWVLFSVSVGVLSLQGNSNLSCLLVKTVRSIRCSCLLSSRHYTPFCSLSSGAFSNGIIHFAMLLYILTPLLIPNSDRIWIGNSVFIQDSEKMKFFLCLFQETLRGFYEQWLVYYFGCNAVLI